MRTLLGGLISDRRRAGPNNARSSFTTGRNGTLVVDFQDSDTVLNIREVLGIFPRLVLDVSVGGVILGEERPITCTA